MARTLNISQDNDKDEMTTVLQKATQSANLNFIIGSGCSFPAIETLGNIEKQVQDNIDAGKHNEADRILFDYLQYFITSVECLRGTPIPLRIPVKSATDSGIKPDTCRSVATLVFIV